MTGPLRRESTDVKEWGSKIELRIYKHQLLVGVLLWNGFRWVQPEEMLTESIIRRAYPNPNVDPLKILKLFIKY